MEPIPVKTTNLCEVLSFYVQFKEYLSSDFAGVGYTITVPGWKGMASETKVRTL